MRKIIKRIIIVLLTLSCIISIGLFLMFQNRNFFNTKINGVDVSLKTYEDAYLIMKDYYFNPIDIYTPTGEIVTVSLNNYFSIREDISIPRSFKEWLFTRDRKALVDFVNITNDEYEFLSRYSREAVLPELIWNEESNKIEMTDYSTAISYDTKEVTKALQHAISDRSASPEERVYIATKGSIESCVIADTETEEVVQDLTNKMEELKWLEDFFIEYSDGSSITGKELWDNCVSDSYVFDSDSERIKNKAKEIFEANNTFGKSYEFITNADSKINVQFVTYGNNVQFEDIYNNTLEVLNSKISGSIDVSGTNPTTRVIGDTYIEVSIENQHCWLYKENKLIMESDIVTGNKGNHDTPTGVYYISQRQHDRTLRGDGYESFVNRWMRITDRGHGFHDATWRRKFGGNIYTYDGSHGCINLPKKFAYDLYEETYYGMPVIIY